MENIKSFLITGKGVLGINLFMYEGHSKDLQQLMSGALSSKILNKTNCEIINNVFYLQEIRYLI